MKYQKKPVIIEARLVPTCPAGGAEIEQYPVSRYVDECVKLAEWCGGESHMMTGREDHILIKTLEGEMKAMPGDWIIQGVKGEFYPCKPDIFAATYEPAEVTSAAEFSAGAHRARTSPAHARKMLYDFMDSKRPWANCRDVYPMMEEIVEYAEFAFLGTRRPTMDELNRACSDLMRFTQHLDEHPEDYEGPCNCAECRQSGD